MATEQDKTIKTLQIAIQMEIDGKEFYQKASQASQNDLGKELLKTLSHEEDIHRQKFEEIYESIRNKKVWPKVTYHPDGGKGLKNVFAKATKLLSSKVSVAPTELAAIKTAMDMENKTYDFYMKRGKDSTYHAEQELYQALAAQEKTHHATLLDYYEFLKNPAGWFVEKEHPSLDGG